MGVTEYLDFKTKSKGKTVMLIYNKSLSVSPLTTHLPLKKVHKYTNPRNNQLFFIKNYLKSSD